MSHVESNVITAQEVQYLISLIMDSQREQLINNVIDILGTHTNRIYLPKNQAGPIACLCLQDDILFHNSVETPVTAGSVIFIEGLSILHDDIILPKISIVMYEQYSLPYIYTNIAERILYAGLIKDMFKHLHQQPMWKQCWKDVVKVYDRIGSGCYGNVFTAFHDMKKFAIKTSKLRRDEKCEFSINRVSWHETYVLENILKPIIVAGKCQNLPLIYDTITCDNCKLELKSSDDHSPETITTITELASGTLKEWLLEKKRTDKEYGCALFQIMAGLHAMQKYGQLLHYDIKKENILFYQVEKGGYWVYKIMGNKYYIPNIGYIFVIGDLGLARSMSLEHPMVRSSKNAYFRMGTRAGLINGNKIVPIPPKKLKHKVLDILPLKINGQPKSGVEYKYNRKKNKIVDIKLDIPKGVKFTLNEKVFADPMRFPPFEFYNDTQDVIRMFLGGKRTTQNGYHVKYNTVPDSSKFVQALQGIATDKEYVMKTANIEHPYQITAGHFINEFYRQRFKRFKRRPTNTFLIDAFDMD